MEYELLVEVEGEDETGAKHYAKWTFFLNVDREKNDVRLDRANLATNSIVCEGETSLSVKIVNYGSYDQDDVILTIFNEALGLDIRRMNIELEDGSDEDNYFIETFTITIGEGVLAGTFNIEVRVSDEDGKIDDHQLVQLTVMGCTEEVVDESVVLINTPADDETLGGESALTSGAVVSTVESTQSKGMTAFMVVVVVLLVLLIALMLGVLIKK